jgi:hypothetical protein
VRGSSEIWATGGPASAKLTSLTRSPSSRAGCLARARCAPSSISRP